MSGSVSLAWHTHEAGAGQDLAVLGLHSIAALGEHEFALAVTEPLIRDRPESLEVAEYG